MQIQSTQFFVITCIIMVACSTQRAANAPLIFHLESKDGARSCLMATSHAAVTLSPESKELIDCIKSAKAYAFEVNIDLGPKNTLQLFERGSGEISFTDLNQSVKEKIQPALIAAKYNKLDIEYILKLHPAGIYRALISSKKLDHEIQSFPNTDILLARAVLEKKEKYIELEGFEEWSKSERQFSLDQLNEIISIMCDLVLDPIKLAAYKAEINKFVENINVLPDIETAWNLKFYFNTQMLGLPAYSMAYEVDNRNALIGKNMLKAMEENGQVMMFVGAAHVGGPASVLKVLEQGGVRVKRVQ